MTKPELVSNPNPFGVSLCSISRTRITGDCRYRHVAEPGDRFSKLGHVPGRGKEAVAGMELIGAVRTSCCLSNRTHHHAHVLFLYS